MKNLLAFAACIAVGFLLGSRRARKTDSTVVRFKVRGTDLVAIARLQNYRQADEAICRADIQALQARQDAGETLTDDERATLYKYAKIS